MSVCVGRHCYETVKKDNKTFYVRSNTHNINELNSNELGQVSEYIFECIKRSNGCYEMLLRANNI